MVSVCEIELELELEIEQSIKLESPYISYATDNAAKNVTVDAGCDLKHSERN